MTGYEQPEAQKDAFHCPHCGSYSDQHWTSLVINRHDGQMRRNDFDLGCCRHCHEITIWKDRCMIFPFGGTAPLPNPDMPENIKKDYLEARNVVSSSPRSACMLLRLCTEKICNEKVPSGSDLNEKIGKLVERGLDNRIQKALDSTRVIGGEAVHPLQMDLKDDTNTATALFYLVNYISEWAHTREKEIDNIFNGLPSTKKNAISRRDAGT